jgi:hypothetical protein
MVCGCGRDGDFKSEGINFCRFCFIDRFEGRVKKALVDCGFTKGQRVLVVGELAGYLFGKLVSVPVEVTYAAEVSAFDGLVIVERTLEDECVAFLQRLGGDASDGQKCVSLFRLISEQDVIAYAQLKGISFVSQPKNEHWLKFLKSFDDHPEMKRNMLRMAGEIGHG